MTLRSNYEPGTSRWATRRAQWLALGLSDADMLKPKIAIVNTSSQLAICFSHLDEIARRAKRAIEAAGGIGFEVRTAAGLTEYIAGMQAAGLGNDNAIENGQEGWDAGLEVDWAIKQAGNLDETTIMQKLQHLNINTLGIVWTRTPANYESYSDVDAAMAIINPDGSASLYQAGT